MPDVEEKKQDLVDIDTSGPGADVDIEETKDENTEEDSMLREEALQLEQLKTKVRVRKSERVVVASCLVHNCCCLPPIK